MSSGAFTPQKATEEIYQAGLHHLHEPIQLAFVKNIIGGLLLSFGGLLTMTVTAGSPGIKEANPGLYRLLQGVLFPIGLIAIYFIGAELYTGYPMWLAMTALQRKGRPIQYLTALVSSWLGNLTGALLCAFVFTYSTQALSEEPYRSGVIEKVESDILGEPWHIIFLKAIGCGYLVTLAMYLGTQNKDGVSKALALHLPFFLSITAQFPHTVEYMFLGPIAMMLGADISIGTWLWKCMLPVSLGNAIGGSVLTGAYNWWVYMYCADGEKARDWFRDGVGNGILEDGE